MKRRLFVLLLLSLSVSVFAATLYAGIEPTPFRADTNKLEAVVLEDSDNGLYRKFVIDSGRLAGAILFGDTRGSDAVIDAIKVGKDVSACRDQLANIDFDFSALS